MGEIMREMPVTMERSAARKRPASDGDRGIDVARVHAFIEEHYLKNRTIVSADIPSILDGVEQATELPVLRHRFRTGEDHGTWVVPPQWDVREAWLKDRRGRMIASYQDHPLFVAPYSQPVRARLSKEQLVAHVATEPTQPDAFAYSPKLATDARYRLKEWRIALPQRVLDGLDEGPFDVLIDAEVKDGAMLVGEIVLPGEHEETIALLADYCHPGQVNDSFSGLVVFMEVMRTLSRLPRRRYTYKLLMFPETIGSAIYLASGPERVKAIRGAMFCEAVGWGDQWYLKATRRGNTYMDFLAADVRRAFPEVRTSPFFGPIYGNDELMFDSVQVGIPCLSLQKYPFPEYHTSHDAPDRLVEADLCRAYEIALHLVRVAEQDEVYTFTQPVPFWMTRFDLYGGKSEGVRCLANPLNQQIVYSLLDGRVSVLKIADALDVPFEEVVDYVSRMQAHKLVQPTGASPW